MVWSTRKFALSLAVIVASTMTANVLYAQPPTGGKWEYKASSCDESSLNSLGDDGWELVSISPPVVSRFSGSLLQVPQGQPGQFSKIDIGPDPSDSGAQNCTAFLKRPK